MYKKYEFGSKIYFYFYRRNIFCSSQDFLVPVKVSLKGSFYEYTKIAYIFIFKKYDSNI